LDDRLIVALGETRYCIERPWGEVPAGLGKVTDVTVSSQGHVFLLVRRDPYVEEPADCVVKLDPQGRFVGSWGRGRILDAHMIACDAQDRLWVVDRDAHDIVAFDAEGKEVAALGKRHRPLEPFNHPSDVAFGPGGEIFVADGYGGGRIHRFDAGGREIASWGEVGVAPGAFLTAHGIWALRDGRVIVADRENHRLQVFRDELLEAIWTGFYRPSDIWVDAEERIYVSDGVPTLTLLDATGRRLGRCRPVLTGAHGLWGGADGSLYLAEGNPNRLTRLVPSNRE
jgi:streptogramin lyase